MKRTSTLLPGLMVAALATCATPAIHAAGMALPSPMAQDINDTVISGATKSIIESFGELTRTATKLSETALKLIEAQKEIDEQRARRNGQQQQQQQQDIQATQGEAAVQNNQAAQPIQTPPMNQGLQQNQDTSVRQPQIITQRDTIYTPSETIYIYPDERPGGKYVWVPDGEELTPRLKGTEEDLNEMTMWKGDSIHMAIPTKRLGRYDRKLYNWLIYPKGQWHISLSANYGSISTDDSEFLSLMKDIDMNGKIYSIKPSVSYFFKSNLNAGLRLAFTKGEMGIQNFNVDIDDDMNFNLHDVKYSSDSYSAALFLQQHFGLSRRGRFSVYNEVEIAYGIGNKHFVRPFDGEMKDTRTKTNSFNINYSPGVSIMMMKQAAFNLSFGIFGFHLQNEKQWDNGEEAGSRFTSGINFRFNIFNINFGVSVII